ncbi:MAG TPA: YbaN family protein [Azonexus sp.]
MKRPFYRACGLLSVALGIAGAVLPLLPTTPFLILAAYCFACSHPEWEARLLAHPQAGPAIRAWRKHGAIPLAGKRLATLLMAISMVGSWFLLAEPWRYVPLAVAAVILPWMWSRPSR